MASLAILIPLLMAIGVQFKYKQRRAGFIQYAQTVYTVGAFLMLAIGGQAPKAIRSVECYDFKVKGKVFLQTLRVGGVGVTLQRAPVPI